MVLGPASIVPQFQNMSMSIHKYLVGAVRKLPAADAVNAIVEVVRSAAGDQGGLWSLEEVVDAASRALDGYHRLTRDTAIRMLDVEALQHALIRKSQPDTVICDLFLVYAEHGELALIDKCVSVISPKKSERPRGTRVLGRGRCFMLLQWMVRDMLRSTKVEFETLEFFDRCLAERDIAFYWEDPWIHQAVMNSPSASGAAFLLRRGTKIPGPGKWCTSTVAYKFLLVVGYFCVTKVFTRFIIPDEIRRFTAENLLMPDNATFTVALNGITPIRHQEETRAITNRIFDEKLCDIRNLWCIATLSSHHIPAITTREMLTVVVRSSFRVYISAAKDLAGFRASALGDDVDPAVIPCMTDARTVLVEEFRVGRYCAKDPGFLLMFWCTADFPGRRRRLPSELTRMVFETAYTG